MTKAGIFVGIVATTTDAPTAMNGLDEEVGPVGCIVANSVLVGEVNVVVSVEVDVG